MTLEDFARSVITPAMECLRQSMMKDPVFAAHFEFMRQATDEYGPFIDAEDDGDDGWDRW